MLRRAPTRSGFCVDLLVSVDRSVVRPGKMDETMDAFRELAAFVEAHEPRPLAYTIHPHPDGRQVTVVQVHPDSASMETHMDVAAAQFHRFRDLLEIVSIDVYGRATPSLLARMDAKARMLGSAAVLVHGSVAGFSRVGGPGPLEPPRAFAPPSGLSSTPAAGP